VSERLRSLVFGGSGALGRAVVHTLSAEGGRTAFTYHTGRAVAEEMQKQIPDVTALQADLTRVDQVEQAVDDAVAALGGIDAFIHCAAVGLTPGDPVPPGRHQRLDEVSPAGWEQLMAVNVKSAFFACRRLTPHLRRAGGGSIVLVGSVDGVKPLPSPVPYAASKGALTAMVQTMAKELGKDGVRVNLVAPGVLEAGLSRALPKALLNDYLRHCGLQRLGRLTEVASLIAWLACHNTYITGQTLVVDGAL
jgi:NAD(P)-dependent dehydrogenase (short-subunit alcohol dehydrogenase family)